MIEGRFRIFAANTCRETEENERQEQPLQSDGHDTFFRSHGRVGTRSVYEIRIVERFYLGSGHLVLYISWLRDVQVCSLGRTEAMSRLREVKDFRGCRRVIGNRTEMEWARFGIWAREVTKGNK